MSNKSRITDITHDNLILYGLTNKGATKLRWALGKLPFSIDKDVLTEIVLKYSDLNIIKELSAYDFVDEVFRRVMSKDKRLEVHRHAIMMDGNRAFYRCKSIESNPHYIDSDEYKYWRKGWIQACEYEYLLD